jgi:exo-beta-1,3-glucanase (GH17 family)
MITSKTKISASLLLLFVACRQPGIAAEPDRRNPLFAALTADDAPTLVTYTPSQLDPRQEVNQRRLATSSIRSDLESLRPAFDGLVLYGYHEACTPRILAVAKDLKFRVILLAIWDPKSTAEVDGVAELARHYEHDFALGILVGNEGITFKRYEAEDLSIAAARLRRKISASVPLATSEPLIGYQHDFVLQFGDFLAPNIHPVFDNPDAGPQDAARWVHERAAELAHRAGKPIMIKETGFPHGGKEKYTPATQNEFWQSYLKPGVLSRASADAPDWVFRGVAFEAFDLPWKSEESNLGIERHWGLLSAQRSAYPALATWKAARESPNAKSR